MAPKRLSDDEKKEIVDLYRQPEETTSTLASRYGVSSSTISRILKQNLSTEEYDALVQQKRTSAGKPSPVASNAGLPNIKGKEVKGKDEAAAASEQTSDAQAHAQTKTESDTSSEPPTVEPDEVVKPQKSSWSAPKLRSDRASAVPSDSKMDESRQSEPVQDESTDASDEASDEDGASSRRRRRRSRSTDADSNGHQPSVAPPDVDQKAPPVKSSRLDEEDDEEDDSFATSGYSPYEDDDDLDDDDLDDEFSDLDDDDEDEEDDDIATPIQIQHHDLVKVFPLSEVELPRTCYLVIDRFAELIAPPLKDFAELGTIPEEEMTAKTLPIFDNHRVAKRFANRRTQRIVKVPDGRMLKKTMPYLSAKGITRLLLDGQVYSLADSE